MDADDLRSRFMYHPPQTPQRYAAHEDIRKECYRLALGINAAVADSREKLLAITHLEEVMFWANAALARDRRE